jgi:group I intron endonuclease
MIIYKTTNLINNKIYVGKYQGDRTDYIGSGTYLKRAIKKYGKENFKREILEYCETSELLCEREKFWIKELNSMVPNGYNVCRGGQGGTGGDRFTNNPNKEQIRKRMSDRNKGKKWPKSDKWREWNSKRLMNNKYSKGCKRSIEYKEKHSKLLKKSIIQFTINNELVKKWDSMTQALKELHIGQGHISAVAHKKRKSAGGFIWKFGD